MNFLGKTATWVLYLAVGCVIVTTDAERWPLVLFWIGVGLAIAAAVAYAVGAWRSLGGRVPARAANLK